MNSDESISWKTTFNKEMVSKWICFRTECCFQTSHAACNSVNSLTTKNNQSQQPKLNIRSQTDEIKKKRKIENRNYYYKLEIVLFYRVAGPQQWEIAAQYLKIFRSTDNRESFRSSNWQLKTLHFFFWIGGSRPISICESAFFTWTSSIFKKLSVVQKLGRNLESFLFHRKCQLSQELVVLREFLQVKQFHISGGYVNIHVEENYLIRSAKTE